MTDPLHHSGRYAAACGSFLTLWVGLSFAAQTADLARTTVSLDQGWRFHLGDVTGANAPGYDDRDWRRVDVPRDYAMASCQCSPPCTANRSSSQRAQRASDCGLSSTASSATAATGSTVGPSAVSTAAIPVRVSISRTRQTTAAATSWRCRSIRVTTAGSMRAPGSIVT